MLMGIQRSGTNALFYSLSKDSSLSSFNEAGDSVIYKDCFLRPESEIRGFLNSAPGPVLLKPLNDTKTRSVDNILGEYANYDVWVVWLYRDPVNVAYSTYQKWPQYSLDTLKHYLLQYVRRTRYILSISPEYSPNLAIVKYEDIIKDPSVFTKLCSFLGVRGSYLFRGDSQAGRKKFSKDIVKKIDEATADIVALLDKNRTFVPEQ